MAQVPGGITLLGNSGSISPEISFTFKSFILSLLQGIVSGVLIIFPVLLEPVSDRFGWSLQRAGWVAACGYASFALAMFVGSWLMNKLNRRGLAATEITGLSIGLLVVAFSPSGTIFISGWALTGIAAGMYHPLGRVLSSSSARENSERLSGLFRPVSHISRGLIPLLVGTVAAAFSWRVAFGVGALAVAGLLMIFVLNIKAVTKVGGETASLNLQKLRGNWPVLLVFGLGGFIYRGVITFIPFSLSRQWAGELSLGSVGALTTVVFLIGTAAYFIGGFLADKIKFYRLYSIQILVVSFLFLTLPVTLNWGFVLGLFFWGIVFYSSRPVIEVYFNNICQGEAVGAYARGIKFIHYISGSLGAGLAGTLVKYFGIYGLFWGMAAVSLLMLFFILYLSVFFQGEN